MTPLRPDLADLRERNAIAEWHAHALDAGGRDVDFLRAAIERWGTDLADWAEPAILRASEDGFVRDCACGRAVLEGADCERCREREPVAAAWPCGVRPCGERGAVDAAPATYTTDDLADWHHKRIAAAGAPQLRWSVADEEAS